MKYIKDKNMINIFREIKVMQEIIIIIISKIFKNFIYFKFSILKNNFRIQISKNVNSPPIVAINNRTVKINAIILSPHSI
jgi:hypothetical protein